MSIAVRLVTKRATATTHAATGTAPSASTPPPSAGCENSKPCCCPHLTSCSPSRCPPHCAASPSSTRGLIYNLLFRASAAAAQELARDPRFIGGQLGLIGILQTWARNLTYHPHIHYLVPGGGWDPTTQAWRTARPDFLLPVKALSVLFRAKFRDGLRQHALFRHIPAAVWQQDWVVHCLPVGNGAPALKYLAPYVFQVAISNRRIVSLENDQVSFVYTDARTHQRHTCTLDAHDFIDRFLQHVLPKGFCKVRYYGCFSPSQRPTLQAVRHWFAQTVVPIAAAEPPATAAPPPAAMRCPKCGQVLSLVATLQPTNRSPPSATDR